MSAKHESSLTELIHRGSLFHELLSVSYIVQIVLRRAEDESVKQPDLDKMVPPVVKLTKSAGADAAAEYIRDTLIATRQVVTSLYNENRALRLHVAHIEKEVDHQSQTPFPAKTTLETGPLQIEALTSILEEFDISLDSISETK